MAMYIKEGQSFVCELTSEERGRLCSEDAVGRKEKESDIGSCSNVIKNARNRDL